MIDHPRYPDVAPVALLSDGDRFPRERYTPIEVPSQNADADPEVYDFQAEFDREISYPRYQQWLAELEGGDFGPMSVPCLQDHLESLVAERVAATAHRWMEAL